ncbi:MAG: N-acetyltransferase [Bacteroidales bacterium]|nr:N-acetyltransferase [Bacteroidales bacterium]
MSVEIVKVSDKAGLKLFAEYPNKLYKGNPYYVPTLVSDDLKTFDKKVNAAYDFCDADFFLAYKDGALCGRVAAILNPKANDRWGAPSVRFGWIDFIDDREVSRSLLEVVSAWGAERGMNHIEGPLGFTDMDTEGMLVEGFEELGTMVTFYNHPYYKEHLEALGYSKITDWVERRIRIPDSLPEKYERYSQMIKDRYHLKTVKFSRREINKRGLGYELFELVNNTYNVLFGYSALSPRQIDQYVKQYLSMLDLDLVSFVMDENDKLVAFGVMMPSMSKALQKADGKFFPFGWFHLAKALMFKCTDTVDMLLIAVHPDYQTKGVPALIITDIFAKLIKFGFKWAETNPELEDNHAVQNLWVGFEHRQHRRRRIYGKNIE